MVCQRNNIIATMGKNRITWLPILLCGYLLHSKLAAKNGSVATRTIDAWAIIHLEIVPCVSTIQIGLEITKNV